MRKLYLVSDRGRFFAQGLYPWLSMDYDLILSELSGEFDIEDVSLVWVGENANKIKDALFLYNSSQNFEHKKLIEDVLFFVSQHNYVIPSVETMYAHENKGFQSLLASFYGITDYIDSAYYSDISQVPSDQSFPVVVKTIDGASSHGVELVHDLEQLTFFLNSNIRVNLKIEFKRLAKKYFFRWKYLSEWYDYQKFSPKRFVLQEYIPNLNHDYKVLVFSDKYYVLKRFVVSGGFKASGGGSWSRSFDDELPLVLDCAFELQYRIKSPVYSIDILIDALKAKVIEMQFTHVGPITLTESSGYYTRVTCGKWEFVEEKPSLEREFCSAVKSYIKKYCNQVS